MRINSRILAGLLMLLVGGMANLAMAQPITVTDDVGTHTFEHIPKRVAALDWNLIEQVIELGVTPLTATDVKSYGQWVVKPALPKAVHDVGTRGEPNLEKIAALKPDVILITQSQKPLMARLKQIAPVLYYDNFAPEVNSAKVAIHNFKRIAHLLGKEDVAQDKLTAMNAHFAMLKQKIAQHFKGQPPKVLPMRLADTTSAYIYTKNSMSNYVLEQLGLQPALALAPGKWNIVQKPIEDLQHIQQGYVLYILPFNQEKQLQKSFLWQAMPFVRKHHVNAVRSVWSYGGAMSLQYMADAYTDSLLEMPVE